MRFFDIITQRILQNILIAPNLEIQGLNLHTDVLHFVSIPAWAVSLLNPEKEKKKRSKLHLNASISEEQLPHVCAAVSL